MLYTKLLDLLIQNGYKVTKQRRIFCAIFSRNVGRYLSAKELKQCIQDEYEWNISYDTIYNNLAMFQAIGMIKEKNLRNERVYIVSVLGEDTHQLICTECGTITEVEDLCHDAEIQKRFPAYKIQYHVYEIYGVCPTCQEGGVQNETLSHHRDEIK